MRGVFALFLAAAALGLAAPAARPQDDGRRTGGTGESRSAPRRSDPRARWSALTDEQKDRFRQLFEEFRKLPESERALVRERLEALADERVKLEANLTEADRSALESIDKDAREAWLRKAAAELVRERHNRMRGYFDRDRFKKMVELDPAKRRQALEELSEDAARAAIRRFTEFASRRNILTAAEANEIRALPVAEAAPRIAALRKAMVIADVERKPELRAEVGDESWEQLKALPPEEFLRKIEATRAFHRSLGRAPFGPPPSTAGDDGRTGPVRGRFGRGGPHGGGPLPSWSPDVEARLRAEARRRLEAEGLTTEEIEKRMQEPLWKILRPRSGDHGPRTESGRAEPHTRPRAGR